MYNRVLEIREYLFLRVNCVDLLLFSCEQLHRTYDNMLFTVQYSIEYKS